VTAGLRAGWGAPVPTVAGEQMVSFAAICIQSGIKKVSQETDRGQSSCEVEVKGPVLPMLGGVLQLVLAVCSAPGALGALHANRCSSTKCLLICSVYMVGVSAADCSYRSKCMQLSTSCARTCGQLSCKLAIRKRCKP
jgi:hypothetical protein